MTSNILETKGLHWHDRRLLRMAFGIVSAKCRLVQKSLGV